MASTHHPTAKHAVLPWAACAVAAISALAAPTVSAQAQGQRIAVDPRTGQLRAPELDEMSQGAARAASRTRRRALQLPHRQVPSA